MKIFNFLKPFISVKGFESSSKAQMKSVGRYLDLLHRYDQKIDEPRKMEFFFYSRTRENANDLKKDLEKLGYEIYKIEKSTNNQYSIIGVTSPQYLEDDKFTKWIKKMNETGFINDCKFDGWGTISKMD